MPQSIGGAMYHTVRTGALSIDQRLERLTELGEQAEALCSTERLADPVTRLEGLRHVGWVACQPSLELKAQRQPPNHTAAIEVYSRLQHFFSEILVYEGAHFTRPGPDQDDIEGSLAELAILGLLCWGAADVYEGRYYILPATLRQDYGGVENGFRTGTDLLIYDGFQRLIQVKRSRNQEPADPPYRPDITVLKVDRVMRELPSRATLLLMDACVREDQDVLFAAHGRAESAMQHAKLEGRKYYRQLRAAAAFAA